MAKEKERLDVLLVERGLVAVEVLQRRHAPVIPNGRVGGILPWD